MDVTPDQTRGAPHRALPGARPTPSLAAFTGWLLAAALFACAPEDSSPPSSSPEASAAGRGAEAPPEPDSEPGPTAGPVTAPVTPRGVLGELMPTAPGAPMSRTPGSAGSGARPREIEAVDLDEGEVVWVEDHYRGSNKLKTRRQVRRTSEGMENHGHYERLFENGVVAEEGEFERGQRVGVWMERFDTGQPKIETHYRAGELHGLKREWSDVGFVKKETWFEDGLRHGDYTVWDMRFEGRRFVKTRGQHERGLKVGVWEVFYRNEALREKGLYVDGLREGSWTFWQFDDNKLQREAEFRAGEWHGRVADYDELGNLASEGIYEQGKLNGPLIEFHPEGTVKSEKLYVDGRPSGPVRTYHPDGTPESEGELVDGKREGLWTYWNEDGSVNESWTGHYHDGELAPADETSSPPR